MSSTSGLSQYVQNDGPILDAGNYNEMDALVLASLSYIEFEKIYPDYQQQNVNLKQFAKDALASDISLSDNQRTLLEQIQNTDRYSACTIHSMAAENESSQWAAMTVDINDGSDTSVIAIRGTNKTELGWNEDFQLAYAQSGTEAQKLSAEYLQNSSADNIFLTGHSKGGNNAISAYVMSDALVRERVIHIDNFDGPGVNDEFRAQYQEGYGELKNKLDNYYPENSVFGLLLNDNPGQAHFIQCEKSEEYAKWGIFGEHDPYSWMLDEDSAGFQGGEQSQLSDTLNHLLDNTLDNLSQKERWEIVQVIIGMQIPSAIAEKDTLYKEYADNIEVLLQSLYESQILPEWPKKLLKDIARVAAGFQLYGQLTEQQKEILKKTLALLVVNAVDIYVKPKVEEILDWMAEQYRFVANVIRRKQAELAALITRFANSIHEEIGAWCNKVWDFLFRDKNRFGRGGDGPTEFEVNPRALTLLAQELQAQQCALQQCECEVRLISRALLGQMSVWVGWQVGRLADNIEQEARACGRMSTALYHAGQQYSTTETQIAATAGL